MRHVRRDVQDVARLQLERLAAGDRALEFARPGDALAVNRAADRHRAAAGHDDVDVGGALMLFRIRGRRRACQRRTMQQDERMSAADERRHQVAGIRRHLAALGPALQLGVGFLRSALERVAPRPRRERCTFSNSHQAAAPRPAAASARRRRAGACPATDPAGLTA